MTRPQLQHRQEINLVKGDKTFSTATPTDTAAQILAANAGRIEALIRNAGTQTVYLGVSNNVTSGNGFPLEVGEILKDDRTLSAWFAIVESGTGDLRIIEVA